MGEYKFTPNTYSIVGDLAYIGLCDRAGAVVAEAIIDRYDLDRVIAYGRWSRVPVPHQPTSFYVFCNKRRMSLHRLIAGNPAALFVDHENGNPLDCRRANLRPCTHTENMQNRQGANRSSVSGVRNVYWHKYHQRWEVRVRVDNRRFFIGRFDDLADAETAAIEARRRLMPFATK